MTRASNLLSQMLLRPSSLAPLLRSSQLRPISNHCYKPLLRTLSPGYKSSLKFTPWHPRQFSTCHPLRSQDAPKLPQGEQPQLPKPTIKENIYTLPNLLTVSRIVACPVLGWSILHDNFHLATGLLVYAGLSDWVRLVGN